jgi:hypothetical protein
MSTAAGRFFMTDAHEPAPPGGHRLVITLLKRSPVPILVVTVPSEIAETFHRNGSYLQELETHFEGLSGIDFPPSALEAYLSND